MTSGSGLSGTVPAATSALAGDDHGGAARF